MKLQLSHNSEHVINLDRSVTDIIKLLSILMIASHHFFQTALTRGDGGLFASLYCSQAGYLGVALFFFLSGYGLAKSNQRHQMRFGEFINKRFLKIVLPMVLANLLWAVFCFVVVGKLNVLGLSQKLDVKNVPLGGGILFIDGVLEQYRSVFRWYLVVHKSLTVIVHCLLCLNVYEK